MTISKHSASSEEPKQGKYDANYDPRPKTVTVGVSLITVEEHTFEQDGQAVTCPVDEEVIYLTAKYEFVFCSNGCDYDSIALLAEKAGYPRSHWKVVSVWLLQQIQEF